MNKVITTERIPIMLWLDDIDDKAMEQAKNAANLPIAFHHIAIMPDAHMGYGVPIGSVIATKGAVIPNAVGVDIGCGMCVARTELTEITTDALKDIMGKIREAVPLGFNHHKTPQSWGGFDTAPDISVIQRELASARNQLGTLGGGNHFIEIQKGSDGYIYAMVHSGSRNFGLKIAKEYHDIAKSLCARWHSDVPDPDLSFLPLETNGEEYIEAMNYALAFARVSRSRMMDAIAVAIFRVTGGNEKWREDVHHNYAAMENHFGANVMVHRKGAILAREGMLGIIPGSQGTKSYIVKGKGEPRSFCSSSHGSGRRMGRKQATRELNLEAEKRMLDEQGIIHAVRTVDDLEEAAGAYKDISIVMENQRDLADAMVELSPLAVIKA
jgi:tRNA-splicing ligase RtcB